MLPLLGLIMELEEQNVLNDLTSWVWGDGLWAYLDTRERLPESLECLKITPFSVLTSQVLSKVKLFNRG